MSFRELLMSGGDERLDAGDSGRNKYFVDPLDGRSVFNRASCTCSPLSPRGWRAAEQLYGNLKDTSFAADRRLHAERIKRLLNLPGCDRFEVFFAPSGSDLCYYPLLFGRLIYPKRPLFNVITCPEELGSGSLAAHEGRYFARRNQLGQLVPTGSSLDPNLAITTATFPARNASGHIADHRREIENTIHAKYATHAVLANIVIGSKSGIENNTAMLTTAPDDVLWTADLCQFRASRSLINGLIGMNACVMLTGSKFYHAPPFCGMLLVPKTLIERFQHFLPALIAPFGTVFSAHDIPESLPALRECLPPYPNYGLLLRWEAALAEMDAFARVDDFSAREQIRRWNSHIVDAMRRSESFELMPGQEETNKTIISFRLRSKRRNFDGEQLNRLYADVCTQTYATLKNAERVLIGQPVRYQDRAFLRVALSSTEVIEFVERGADYSNDDALLQLLEARVNGRICES